MQSAADCRHPATRMLAAIAAIAGTCGLAGMAFAIRAHALRGDDFSLIHTFSELRNVFFTWDELFASPWVAGHPEQLFRPTTGVWLYANVLICGPTARCLAAGNVLLVALAGWALYSCARMIQLPSAVALTAAVVFLISPGAISPQLAIADHPDVLAGLSLLWALLAYHRCRLAGSGTSATAWFGAAVAACIAAMGSKETAALAPWILTGQAVVLGDWRRRRRAFFVETILLTCVLAGYFVVRLILFDSVGGQYGSISPSVVNVPANVARTAVGLLFFNRQQFVANLPVTAAVVTAAAALLILILRAAMENVTPGLRWIVFIAVAASVPALVTHTYARLLFIPAGMLALIIAIVVSAPGSHARRVIASGAASLLLVQFLFVYGTQLRNMQSASRRTVAELAALTALLEGSPRPALIVGYPGDAAGMAVFHRSLDDALQVTMPQRQQPAVGLIASQTPEDRCPIVVHQASSVVRATTQPPCELALPNYRGQPAPGARVHTTLNGVGPVTFHSPTQVSVAVDRGAWDVIVPDSAGGWDRLQ